MLKSSHSLVNLKITDRSEEFNPLILSIERCIEPLISKLDISNPDSTTLLSGLSGISLFYAYCFRKFKDQRFLDKTNDLVNQSIENIGLIEQPSLYQGFTGVAWIIRHLTTQRIFDKSSLDVLVDIDGHIENTIDILASHNYYSLMYGSIGHGVYFSEALKNSTDSDSNDRYTAVLKKILYSLDKASIKTKEGITWVDNTSLDFHQNHKVIYNLGLPHGITGIAAFLSTLIENKIEEELTRKLLDGSLKWLLSKKKQF
jgi:lantibiotic modifying enzyme